MLNVIDHGLQFPTSSRVYLPREVTREIETVGCGGKSRRELRHQARKLRKAIRWLNNAGGYARLVCTSGTYNPIALEMLTFAGIKAGGKLYFYSDR